MSDARFEVRPWREGDDEALLDLHRRAFAGHAPRSLEQWRWKYRDNPLRRTELIVATERDGTPVAAYGGVTHRFVLDGEECRAGLQVDVAVAPQFHGTPTAVRLVTLTGERFFATFAGGATKLTWGYPEPGLHRIGLRRLDFEVLRDVVFLVRESGAPRRAPPRSVVVDRVARFGPVADELWSRCASELRTATIRDARYLDWRYADQPGLEHVLLVARDASSGRARGLAVLRDGGWSDAIVSLLDWLVPLDDRDAEAALVARALDETRARGRGHLVAWFAGAPAIWFRFQRDHGFFAQPTPYQECFRSWVARASRRWLAQHWHQTMGDVDFF